MKLIFLTISLLLPVSFVAGQVPRPCHQDEVRGCSANGRPGQQTCDGGVWGYCKPNPPPPPPPVKGTVTPRYLILTVIYAPLGTNGGKGSSSVTYGSSSTVGTTISSAESFKNSASVTVTASQGVLGSTSVNASFGFTNGSSNTHSVDIKKSQLFEISVSGPPSDGINHQKDEIWLLLSPKIEVSLFPTGVGTVSRTDWHLLTNTGRIQYLYVEWLQEPAKIPPGVRADLAAAGITPQDYLEILKADPFVGVRLNSGTRIDEPDSGRYQLQFTRPYEPPADAGDPVPTQKATLAYTYNEQTSQSIQNEYTVGLGVQTGTGDFLGLLNLSLKDQNTWTWNSSSTAASSSGSTETATVVLGGPAFGYQGSTDVAVYYDLIYKTFLFTLLPPNSEPTLQGFVRTRVGAPVRDREVVVEANGRKYRAYTNARGQYRIFSRLSGPLRIQAGGATKELLQVPPSRVTDVVVP